jgi:hypothetical protein
VKYLVPSRMLKLADDFESVCFTDGSVFGFTRADKLVTCIWVLVPGGNNKFALFNTSDVEGGKVDMECGRNLLLEASLRVF